MSAAALAGSDKAERRAGECSEIDGEKGEGEGRAKKRGIKYETEKAKKKNMAESEGRMERAQKGSDSSLALSGEREFCNENI